MIPLIIGLSMLMDSFDTAKAAPVFSENAQSIEEYVREYFADVPIMAEIARCESRFRHFGKNGSVLRGEIVREDLGVMQVNEYYHGKTADKLGLDLYSIEGNVAYARQLFDKEGTTPWLSSSKCWNKHLTKK
jgi:hypothetical protein